MQSQGDTGADARPARRRGDPLTGEFDSRVAKADMARRQLAGADESAAADLWGLAPSGGSGDAPLTDRMTAGADEMLAQVTAGIAKFSDGAQDRIVCARLRAIKAQHKIDSAAGTATNAAAAQVQRHPLAFGLGAAALGAVAAGLLPRSAEETHRARRIRDRFMNEARTLYDAECRRLTAAASAGVEEDKVQARDALSTASEGNGVRDVDPAGATAKMQCAGLDRQGSAAPRGGTHEAPASSGRRTPCPNGSA